MENSTAINDPTQNALLDEFGRYLGAIADGFASKVQGSMQQAEGEMLARIETYQKDLAASQHEAAERAAAQYRLVEQELESFGSMVRESQTGLEASRRNFEAAILKELTATLQKETQELRSELNAVRLSLSTVSLAVDSNRTMLRYLAVAVTVTLLISAAVLWKIWH